MIKLVFDIETNGFIPDLDRVHCISIYDMVENRYELYDADHKSVREGVERLAEADVLVGHNIISFDAPALAKVYPELPLKAKLIDTYVWAACTWPDIKSGDFGRFRKGLMPASLIGKHTLESYGYRLGIYKGEFCKETDWQVWTPEMSTYCEQDVRVNTALLNKLEDKNCSWEQVELEMDVYRILNRQMNKGVLFDIEKAEHLYAELSVERERLRDLLQITFPPFYKRKGKLFTPKKDMRKRAGEWVGYVAGCAHQKIELVEFNPASSMHVARMLMQNYDWMPTEFADDQKPSVELQVQMDRLGVNSATAPKVDDNVIKSLNYPELEPLAKFLTLNKRCSQLSEGKQGWLKKVNYETSRIHGVCFQFGAVTGRCTHFGPNLAQVPAVYSDYGKECRELFHTPVGWKLVGCDADGLEARCKAHFIFKYDEGAMVKVILDGNKADATDIHSLNRDRLGLTSRNKAKTFYYAFMYGAGNGKLGLTAMEDEAYKDDSMDDAAKLGGALRSKLEREFPGLSELIEAVKSAADRGWLKGLDGRRIPIRSKHAALNSLLQSAGAVIMKKAMVIGDNMMQERGLVPGVDYEQVLFVHDELQWEVKDVGDNIKIVSECAEAAIQLAGEYFKFNCPLSGSSDVGNNWAETH